MSPRILHYLILLAVALESASCSPKTSSPSPSNQTISVKPNVRRSTAPRSRLEKPVPPLQLAVPAALPDRLDNKNLQTMDPAALRAQAQTAETKKLYQVAAPYQYWYVQKTREGQYDLACYVARTGQIDAAFYWLQIAAIEQGLDTEHVKRDEDLESLRRDPRWDKVFQYVEACSNYFESGPFARTVLVLPRGYKKPAALPAILWLHGARSRPDDFVNDDCQAYANELNVAMIGVSATTAKGPRTFLWTEDFAKDAGRIRDALAEVSDRVTIAKGQVIILSFSQGAQLGFQLAVRNPEEYAGAIVLSPGIILSQPANPHLDDLKSSALLVRRGYVLCCNADEYPGTVRLTALDADWLRAAKAHMIHKAYPGVSAHALPPDFGERFPEWVRFILKVASKEEN
jgi:pimeloyl-ACP methyl ester carboxylesterase